MATEIESETVYTNVLKFLNSSSIFQKKIFQQRYFNHQKQNDNYNCGVYVCYFFKVFVEENFDLVEQKVDIDKFRNAIKGRIELHSKIDICCACKLKKETSSILPFVRNPFVKLSCKHKFHASCLQDKNHCIFGD